jgi:hypothetical protein
MFLLFAILGGGSIKILSRILLDKYHPFESKVPPRRQPVLQVDLPIASGLAHYILQPEATRNGIDPPEIPACCPYEGPEGCWLEFDFRLELRRQSQVIGQS